MSFACHLHEGGGAVGSSSVSISFASHWHHMDQCKGFSGILRDAQGFSRIFRDAQGCARILKDAQDVGRIF